MCTSRLDLEGCGASYARAKATSPQWQRSIDAMTAFRRIERKAPRARVNGATEVRDWTCEKNWRAIIKVQKPPEKRALVREQNSSYYAR